MRLGETRFAFAHLGGMSFRFRNMLFPARLVNGLFTGNVYFDISATVCRGRAVFVSKAARP